MLIAELLQALGELPVTTPKCIALAVDAVWRIGFNATPAQQTIDGMMVPAYHCGICFNDWPAGIVGPSGGCIAAGAAANEAAFLDALGAAKLLAAHRPRH
ncbi:MAG: hypothetical protein U0973_11670 [Xanthomonadaceae bacterium]|nr:hypothetical protein [Xanthomonadaceae bacterium]